MGRVRLKICCELEFDGDVLPESLGELFNLGAFLGRGFVSAEAGELTLIRGAKVEIGRVRATRRRGSA